MSEKPKKWFVNQVLDILESVPIKSLTTYERIIIISIAKYADKIGFGWPTLLNIESISGISHDHINRYFPSLKEKKILLIQRKWCKVKHMTKNFYTINLNAIIKLSINEKGVIEVEKDTCIEIEPFSTMADCSKIDRPNDKKMVDCSKTDRPSAKQHDKLSNEPTQIPVVIGSKVVCTEIEPLATVASCSIIDKPAQTLMVIGSKVVCTEIEPLATVATKLPIEANTQEELRTFVQDKTLDTPFFDDFWACYPRKEKKKEAYRIWVKNKLDKIGVQIIRDVVDRQARHDRWEDRAYIPLPTTYLNGELWNDEIIERIKTPPKQNNKPLSKRESNIINLGNEIEAVLARRNRNDRIS